MDKQDSTVGNGQGTLQVSLHRCAKRVNWSCKGRKGKNPIKESLSTIAIIMIDLVTTNREELENK